MIRPLTCPICKKPLPPGDANRPASLPFCSERCRQIDLFRWFDGKYAIVEPLDLETLDPERRDPETLENQSPGAVPDNDGD